MLCCAFISDIDARPLLAFTASPIQRVCRDSYHLDTSQNGQHADCATD